MSNHNYVLDHIERIESRHKNNPAQIKRLDKFIAEVKRTGGANIK